MKNVQLEYLTSTKCYDLYYRQVFTENSTKKYIEVYCYFYNGELQFVAEYLVSAEETYCYKYTDIDMNMISVRIDFNYIITQALDKKFGYE